MLDQMSSQEYFDWQEYFSVEPFPEDRNDIRNAELLQALIVQATQGKNVPKVSDLLPDWWNEKGRRSPESPALIQSKMRMVAAGIQQKKARKL